MRGANKIIVLNIISTFILQGIAFFSTPIFTRLLGTEQYGIYSLFNSWVLILTCIMGCSINSSIGTGIYTFKENYVSFRNSILLSSSVIGLIQILFIFLFRNLISKVIGFPSLLVVIIGIVSFSHYIVNFAQTAFTYEKKAVANLILSILISFFSVFLSILFIYFSKENLKFLGRIYGITITYCVTSLIVWGALFAKKKEGIKKKYLIYGLTIGIPIIFHSLSQQILSQADRVMMQFFNIGSATIGIYSLFYTISSVLSTVLGALNNAWCPFYYDDINEEKWEVLNKKCKNYIELFTVLGIGFLLLSREVSYVMADKSYWRGINIIPILAFSVYFTFIYQFPVNFEFYHRKTKIIALGTVGAGIVNIILNYFMIPLWGMYGAALATAISYLALFFAHYYIVCHMKDNPYHLKAKAFIPGLLGMIAGSIAFYVLSSWWYIRWFLGLSIGCIELYRIYKRKSIF